MIKITKKNIDYWECDYSIDSNCRHVFNDDNQDKNYCIFCKQNKEYLDIGCVRPGIIITDNIKEVEIIKHYGYKLFQVIERTSLSSPRSSFDSSYTYLQFILVRIDERKL